MPTLYDDLVAANQEVSSWQSDLYVTATEKTREIFRQHNQKLLYFKSNIDGKQMLEAPFQYTPFWTARGM